MVSKVWTVDEIKERILTDDRWLERAVVAIYNLQTLNEQSSERTTQRNGVGYSAFHARSMSYAAKWILSGKHLTGKYKNRARKVIPMYAKQLVAIANKEV